MFFSFSLFYYFTPLITPLINPQWFIIFTKLFLQVLFHVILCDLYSGAVYSRIVFGQKPYITFVLFKKMLFSWYEPAL